MRMSPMSLLTMSSDTLQAASLQQPAQHSPHGERGERFYAQALVLMLLAVPLSLLFLR
jgi:hypothetical protein